MPLRADYRTAVKRMHADLQALVMHGGDLGIDCDPIRVAHAYGAQLEAIFADSIEPSFTLQHSSCSADANNATSSEFVFKNYGCRWKLPRKGKNEHLRPGARGLKFICDCFLIWCDELY